jgi:mevalonate pyrophosphate decarboxylase
VYFTLDAGPNVHLLCEEETARSVGSRLAELDYVVDVLHNVPAGPARTVGEAGNSG